MTRPIVPITRDEVDALVGEVRRPAILMEAIVGWLFAEVAAVSPDPAAALVRLDAQLGALQDQFAAAGDVRARMVRHVRDAAASHARINATGAPSIANDDERTATL
jgi:hypothetical protein